MQKHFNKGIFKLSTKIKEDPNIKRISILNTAKSKQQVGFKKAIMQCFNPRRGAIICFAYRR